MKTIDQILNESEQNFLDESSELSFLNEEEVQVLNELFMKRAKVDGEDVKRQIEMAARALASKLERKGLEVVTNPTQEQRKELIEKVDKKSADGESIKYTFVKFGSLTLLVTMKGKEDAKAFKKAYIIYLNKSKGIATKSVHYRLFKNQSKVKDEE